MKIGKPLLGAGVARFDGHRESRRPSTATTIALTSTKPTRPPSAPTTIQRPPTYWELEDDKISHLTFALPADDAGQRRNAATCLAHLRLLFAFQKLKDDIGYNDGLFGICDSYVLREDGNPRDPSGEDPSLLLAKLRERRWGLYVARAVDRFELWWDRVVRFMEPCRACTKNKVGFLSHGKALKWPENKLPPLDVLMVWHTFMLNPRYYLEDCMRLGLDNVWATGMPWSAIDNAINPEFNYVVSEECKAEFAKHCVGHAWENEKGEMSKSIRCPKCHSTCRVRWTTCGVDGSLWSPEAPWPSGEGYGDKDLADRCHKCGMKINNRTLIIARFLDDVGEWRDFLRPFRGTLLDSASGQPLSKPHFLKLLRQPPSAQVAWSGDPKETIRTIIQNQIREDSRSLTATDKDVFRQLMQRYHDNPTPFALNLREAVLRQCIFTEKMCKIDWLHSPVAWATMNQLLTKYDRFFEIISKNPDVTVTPTLDIDLAWHTHQLSPQSYYSYSAGRTGIFVNHDDKIPEDVLSDAFRWTSERYQEMYGEIYSQCTCWYCEAIRHWNTSQLGRALGMSKQAKVTESFHLKGSSAHCPPHNSPHISAHNSQAIAEDLKERYNKRLKAEYKSAVRRAAKKGRTLPPCDEFYSHWGYPYYLYGPYMPPRWLTPGVSGFLDSEMVKAGGALCLSSCPPTPPSCATCG